VKNATGVELIDLIFHQRDQRRDNDSHPLAQQGRELITQGLAATGRQDRYRGPAGQHGFNDLSLSSTKAREAEMASQGVSQRILRPGAGESIRHTVDYETDRMQIAEYGLRNKKSLIANFTFATRAVST
jgi:hypothetical protein